VKRLVLLTIVIAATLLAGSSAPISAAVQPAGGCSDLQVSIAHRFGGSCADWHVIRDGWGNYVGAKFDSNVDTRLRAPRQGRLDTACGQVWSGPNVTRRISVTEATYWRLGFHRNLTKCALSPAKAAQMYRSGDGTAQFWTLVSGSENTGWVYDGPSIALYAYHGHIDHPLGTTWTGNWTPAVEKATGWYWNR
jgi:hypothetical protein